MTVIKRNVGVQMYLPSLADFPDRARAELDKDGAVIK
jgi:hypothetical protein